MSSAPRSDTSREARRLDDRRSAGRRILPVRLRHLEQDAAERVVDLLVVLVLALVEALEDRAFADLLEEIGIAERDHERDHERDGAVGVSLDGDPLGRKDVVELVVGVRPAGNGRLELAVDHAVGAVADGRELVR